MKSIIPILSLIVIVVLSSCDGRDKAHRTTEQDLIENKVLDTFKEVITYIPETYVERTTDSIFDNGFRVKIKNYSDMDNSILNEEKIDSIIYKNYLMEFITHLIVKKNNIPIFDKIINKDFIKEIGDFNSIFLNKSVLYTTWIQDSFPNDKKIVVIFGYCNPTTEKCLYYNISINEKGNYIVKEKKEFD